MKHSKQYAFTLTEMMAAIAISGILLLAILSTYVFVFRGLSALNNYAQIHQDGRYAVDFFTRDARAAYSISSATLTGITFQVPTSFVTDPGSADVGKVLGTNNIRYFLQNQSLMRQDQVLNKTATLATNIIGMTLTTFNNTGTSTANLSQVKMVQLDMSLRKRVISNYQSEDYLSARIVTRNKNAQR